MNTTTFGLDIAKRSFQLYWVEVETGEIANRRFTKRQFIEFLASSSQMGRFGSLRKHPLLGTQNCVARS